MSKIISIATGLPAFRHEQKVIAEFAAGIYSHSDEEKRKLKFLYTHSGVTTRYSVMPDYSVPMEERQFYPATENMEPFPGLEQRMEWYARHAAPLATDTISRCLEGHLLKEQITHLVTVSCTGMSAPGLDLEIMEKMGLPRNIFRTSVNFMGCYAAIHALKIADSICKADPSARVVIVCLEFCTLHFQKEPSTDNITSTLLFADGCAAVLVQGDDSTTKGIRLKKFFSDVAFKGKGDMSWSLSSTGFLMTLSGYVPDLVEEDFEALVGKALANAGLRKSDIQHWCIHPGGKKILEAISKSLSLPASTLAHSYEVLNEYGNMSSPTILFVLQKFLQQFRKDDEGGEKNIFGAAFGPGLTMETFIAGYD